MASTATSTTTRANEPVANELQEINRSDLATDAKAGETPLSTITLE